MMKVKRVVIAVASALSMALLFCTMLSAHIEVWMLPQVRTVNREPDQDQGGDWDRLPASCLGQEQGGPCVYRVEVVDGVWGEEMRVHREPLREVRLQGGSLLLPSQGYDDRTTMYAAYPSRPLKDGDRVQEVLS